MTSPTPRPGILDIKPYKGGSSKAPGAAKVYKLSSNESALGASPAAMEAYRAAGDHLELYPDGSAAALREAIGALNGLDPSRIVCGAGSDELLQLITKAYAGAGDSVVQSQYGFLVYSIAARACGAQARFAPEKNLTTDVDAMCAAVDETTKIVFLANPNNPTGSYIPSVELRRLREQLPDGVLLVVDAAYAEYMEAPDYEDGARLVEERDDVVMTRTFSKAYGLAGLRLGWAYCPPSVADVINRIRGPFNVTTAALEAGRAALADRDFLARNIAHNRHERERLSQDLARLGLDYVPSVGNFLLVRFPDEDGKRAADALAFLKRRGVLVREMDPYGLGEYLRISIGPEEANRACLDALEAFRAG